MPKRVTLRDIAEVAGVHFTTVGLALRNDPRVLPETAGRVRAVARKLGYTHDAMLSALSAYRHRDARRFAGVIAHIVTYDPKVMLKTNTRERTMLGAARAYAQSQGFTIEIFQINAPGMTGERMSRLLRARGIQALILSPRLPGPGPIPDLEWEHFSVVASGYSITNLAVHRCCPHQAHNVLLALQELRRRGYRRTGLILSPSVNLRTRGNILGAYLADQRARPPAERLDLLLEEGVDRSMLQRWLRAQKADSVLLTDYPMQYLAMIRDLGHAVPADFGVAQLSRSGDTDAIAGIDEQMELLGEATAKFAISLLRHNERGLPEFPRYSLVEGRWVVRPTVRAVTGDPK